MGGVPDASSTISTKLQRIAELARQMPGTALVNLSHHIDVAWLKEAFSRTRKDGATGVDGTTAAQYEANLEGNLRSLLERAKSGTYRAPPVRRVHIPKGTGTETRPLGIPTFEDKVLQRAVAMALEAVYEQDFLSCSFGFRPGRSAHHALDALRRSAMAMSGGWVIEVDIRKFFDSIDHARLREILRQRVRDGVLLRLIGKWLNAGVLEEGRVTHPEAGTPQGGVISPLLANVFLHEVLDTWFARDVQPRLNGKAELFRYADDFVILCSDEEDARRVYDVLPKRFGRYGLTLHPTKTRLVDFRKPRPPNGGGSGSFDLLGFTHVWARTRIGRFAVQQRTARSRFRRALQRVARWCRDHRHRPVPEQHATLGRMLRGHCAYYGITWNSLALSRFREAIWRQWVKWLGRRSQRARMTADRVRRLPKLPPATAIHSRYRRVAFT
jgi:group II intron reverse transcriptase/maturase